MTATAPERVPPLPPAKGMAPTTWVDDPRRAGAAVDIAVPVHCEEAGLATSILRLHRYLSERFPLPWVITIVDNASTDGTWAVACRLATELDGVQALHLDAKGRGLALRAAWTDSAAPVVAYMDVDLSTDLDALLPLVAPLLSGHSDVAIGTRLARGAQVVRGPRREAISRAYNLILRTVLGSGFSDAQCGFKAVRSDVARTLLPLVEDQGWFFDTELLVLAEQNGLRIHEVPVDWVDDPDSRVHVVRTATDDLKGVARMVRRWAHGDTAVAPGTLRAGTVAPDGLGGQVVRFASIGVVSTVVYAALFAVLFPPLGAVPANVVALGVCSVANVAANRRLTFSRRGRSGRARHWAAGMAVAALPMVLTVGGLVIAQDAGVEAVGPLLLVATAANALATAARFVVLRRTMGEP